MEDYSCSYIEIHFYTEDGSLHCRLHQGSTVPRALLLSLEGRTIPFVLRAFRMVSGGSRCSKVSECIVIAKAAFELKRLRCGFWC